MRKGIIGLISLSASVALTCFCGTKSNAPAVEAATTIPISSLKLDSTSVPGWADSMYISGDSSNVNAGIDGEEVTYKKHGMQYYSLESMVNAGHTAGLLVLDFVTVQNAENMFAVKKQFGVAWGTYNPNKVVIDNEQFITTVYAQINKYYFEMQFSVDGDSARTVTAANAFYNEYLSLIK